MSIVEPQQASRQSPEMLLAVNPTGSTSRSSEPIKVFGKRKSSNNRRKAPSSDAYHHAERKKLSSSNGFSVVHNYTDTGTTQTIRIKMTNQVQQPRIDQTTFGNINMRHFESPAPANANSFSNEPAYDNPRVRTQMRVDAQDNRYFTPLQKVNQSSPGGTNVKVQWRLNQNRRPGDLSPSTLQVSPNIRRKKMKDSTMQVHDMVKAQGQSDLFNSMKGSMGARHHQLAKILPARRKR